MRRALVLVVVVATCLSNITHAETLTERLNRLHGGSCAEVTNISGQRVGCFIKNDPQLSVEYCQRDQNGTDAIVRLPSLQRAQRFQYDDRGMQTAMLDVDMNATC